MRRLFRQAGVQALRQQRCASAVGESINPNQVGVGENIVKVNGKLVEIEPHKHKGVKTSQLDNGTKVITNDNGGSIAQLTVLYKDGPVFESVFDAGISSFMKHALTKDGLTSSEYITKTFLQKAGIVVRQPEIVNKSYIAFTVEGFRDTLAQAEVMDKFWQALLFPRFSPDSVKEVKRLLELEVKEAKRDTPFEYLMDVLHKHAFKGSPLGHTSYIPSYNLGYIDSGKLFDRWDAHYGFTNIAFVATNLDHSATLDALTASPWLARAHTKPGGVFAPASTYYGGEGYDVCHRAKEFDDQFTDVYNTYTAYAFKAPGRSTLKDYAAALVITQALSNAVLPVVTHTYSSKKLSVFYKAYDTVGLFGLATVQASNAQLKGFKAALAKVGSLVDADIGAHKNAATLAALDLADSCKGSQATLVESFTASGLPLAPADIALAIKSVTAADVKKVVESMLGAPPTLVHHGDSPCAPTLEALASA